MQNVRNKQIIWLKGIETMNLMVEIQWFAEAIMLKELKKPVCVLTKCFASQKEKQQMFQVLFETHSIF